jgi:hypothetical protein
MASKQPAISPADKLLDRLTGVKQIKPDRWLARCPAHDDRAPSLVITETSDGTLLIRCWAGCSAADIVAAVGLDLKDLFPARFDGHAYRKAKAPRYSAREITQTVMTEAMVLTLGYRAVQRGESLPLWDLARLELAVQTIQNCLEVAR